MEWTTTPVSRVGYSSSSLRSSKVKDCTKEPFVGTNVTSDTQGNYYLDQKDKIEGLVKAARVTGAKVQKLPYPLDGPSLSNADNTKDAAEAAECAS